MDHDPTGVEPSEEELSEQIRAAQRRASMEELKELEDRIDTPSPRHKAAKKRNKALSAPDDLEQSLSDSGPASIHLWVQERLASHPQDEKITLERAFNLLRDDFPADAVAYGERLLLQGASTKLLRSLSKAYKKIGSLVRARELADRIKEAPPDLLLRTSKIKSDARLLEGGYPLPERAAEPAYVPVPRRVLYVIRKSQPYVSAGYAIRSQGLAKAIRQHGYDLHCVTRLGYPWDSGEFDSSSLVDIVEQVDGVPYIRLPSLVKESRNCPIDEYLQHWADRLCELAQILKPSVIHAASNFACGTAANLAARRLGLPSIYEVRGLWDLSRISRHPELRDTDRHRMNQRMEAETACNASAVFAITGAVKSELVRRGVPEDKITLLPNGVNVDSWQPRERDRELESLLGLAGKTVIGYLGSLNSYEGLDLLLHATHRLRQRRHDRLAVLIVGDGEMLAKLKKLTEQLQLGDSVLFTGRVPHTEVARYYSLVDIAPFPRKGFEVCEMVSPLKPFEAMAMSKAIICSDVAALAEIVSHEKTGLLHRKDDVESLANCLERLLRSPELRSRLGSQARDWVRANRDWKALAGIVGDTYDALTA